MDLFLDYCQLGLRVCLAHERTAVHVNTCGRERPTPTLVTLLDVAENLGPQYMRLMREQLDVGLFQLPLAAALPQVLQTIVLGPMFLVSRQVHRTARCLGAISHVRVDSLRDKRR